MGEILSLGLWIKRRRKALDLTQDALAARVGCSRDLIAKIEGDARRLKDLAQPERIFQLLAPGLSADFPPLTTLDARLTNLPAQPTPLIGRQREIAAVSDLLRRDDVRLLTLEQAIAEALEPLKD